jgi:hypothetical protein
MHYDLYVPCSNCPFLRKGGIRLTKPRVLEIAGNMLSPDGKTFACHKTTVDCDGELVDGLSSRHCAGALIFSLLNHNETQMMRIAFRLKLFNPEKLMGNKGVVRKIFGSLSEMLAANEKIRRRQRYNTVV